MPRPLQRSVRLLALPALILAGCGTTGVLETGYDYRSLNSTEVERRAFYADAYSLEAIRAQQETKGPPREVVPGRPGPGR